MLSRPCPAHRQLTVAPYPPERDTARVTAAAPTPRPTDQRTTSPNGNTTASQLRPLGGKMAAKTEKPPCDDAAHTHSIDQMPEQLFGC